MCVAFLFYNIILMKYDYKLYDYKPISIIFLLVLILGSFIFFQLTKKEGYENINVSINSKKWQPDLIQRFNTYQLTVNQNRNQFNMELIQKQASPEEAEEYLKTGKWVWPDNLQRLYLEKVRMNPIINIDPQVSLDYAMSVYNKNAALQLLAWNSKEGKFLLYGLNLDDGTIIKCSSDRQMEKIKDGKKQILKPDELTNEIPGFSFLKSPCNPCEIFSDEQSIIETKKCPFKINIDGDDSVSLPWSKIFGLQ